jgi:hypothetical protein
MATNAPGMFNKLMAEIKNKPGAYAKPPVGQPNPIGGVFINISDQFINNVVEEQGAYEYQVNENVDNPEYSLTARVARNEDGSVKKIHFNIPSGYSIKSFKHADIKERVEKGLDTWSIKRSSVEFDAINIGCQKTCRWLTPSTAQIEEGLELEPHIVLVPSLDYEYDRTASTPVCGSFERTHGKPMPCSYMSNQAMCTHYAPDDSDFAAFSVAYSNEDQHTITVTRSRIGIGMPVYVFDISGEKHESVLTREFNDDEEDFVYNSIKELTELYAIARDTEVVTMESTLTEKEERNSYVEYVASLSVVE